MISEVYLPFTTDGSGAATVQSTVDVFGRLIAVAWTDGDLADGVDAVISCVGSGRPDQTLLTLTNANDDAWHYPMVAASSTAGAALTWYTPQVISGTIKVVVAAGGATKTGAVRLYIER